MHPTHALAIALTAIALAAGRAPAADASPAQATAVADIKVAPGFAVELLYSVPAATMGSWVCLAVDPQGRLITADQYGRLYRVSLPAKGSAGSPRIESIDVDVGMAQGLLCAFGSLYVMANDQNLSRVGLYRVRDSDGDDRYDSVEVLRHLEGNGEHGPHGIVLAPDGLSLLVCCGNMTKLPAVGWSRVPRVWDEDQVLPPMSTPGGMFAELRAPGGWVARVSPDGLGWEVVATGFRNHYDIAVSPEGELFTYDSDMEWDVGTPWYRPTRVNHVVSGGEFGWRTGTGPWPAWHPDSVGAVVDIGPGSPTGVAFGTHAAFPEKYQRALFLCDWSYGTIYAVHLTPSGASYTGTPERFISAAPLPVSDIVVNPMDGAMYFTIGGRRTQSALYRVTFTGTPSMARTAGALKAASDQSTEIAAELPSDRSRAVDGGLRQLRKEIESLHAPGATDAVDRAWPHLGHTDRSIRYAARTAIELTPAAEWTARALAEESSADARINALLAVARCGTKTVAAPLFAALLDIEDEALTASQRLDLLRVIGLAFLRVGSPSTDTTATLAARLDGRYPSRSPALDRELCRLLVHLGHPAAARKTLDLLSQAATQEDQVHYAYCLRALEGPWTIDERREYFGWFAKAARMRGGFSFADFLKNIRQQAIQRLNDAERAALADVLETDAATDLPVVEAESRPFVRTWTVDDLLPDVRHGLSGRDFENGRRMFRLAACFNCHRIAGEGGAVGPDLTAVARRYDTRALLESIIEPSRVISDQYEASVFVLASGRSVVGRVVTLNENVISVCENMLDPGRLTLIRRDEIDERHVSPVSTMPAGLINHLHRNDVLDLVAYLQSGGNANPQVVPEIP